MILLTHLVSLLSFPQRSYTLIVEALDSNNETSGEYFVLVWHLHLAFLSFTPHPPPPFLPQGNVWEESC